MKSDNLSPGEVHALLDVTVFPTMVMALPAELLRSGGSYAWAALVVPLVLALVQATLLLGRDARPLVRNAIEGLGPRAGRIALLAIAAATFAYLTVIFAEFGQLAEASYAFTDVPLSLLIGTATLLAWYQATVGIVTLGRVAQIMLPVLVFVLLLVCVLALPTGDIGATRPWLPQDTRFLGAEPIVRPLVFLSENALVLTWITHSEGRRLLMPVRWAMVLVAGLTAFVAWTTVAVFGPARGATLFLPLMEMGLSVEYAGGFIAHLEVLIIPLMTVGTILKLGAFLYSTTHLVRGVWPKISIRLATAVIALASAFIALRTLPTGLVISRAIYDWLAPYAMPPLILLPVLAHLLATRRRARVMPHAS